MINFEPITVAPQIPEDLQKILATRDELMERRKTPVTFSDPIIYYEDTPIIYPQTINLIQGKSGVHKSRLAETFCSVVLKTRNCNNSLLSFRANDQIEYAVCYVDTERNHKDQLPYAIQQIMQRAGHRIDADIPNFDAISLLNLDRKSRFQALKRYLDHVRTTYQAHILIVLDIITDCLVNFNDSAESMELIDLMNKTINECNVTFICLIHENPGVGSEKARGHLGTELMNKATTHIQVSFEKDKNQESSEIVRIKFMKLRVTRRPEPIFAIYSDQEKGLVKADPEAVAALKDTQRQVTIEDVTNKLTILLTGPMYKADLFAHIIGDLNCGTRTLEARLREIIQQRQIIRNMEGANCHLTKQTLHRQLVYSLTPINTSPTLDLTEPSD